jgi:sporulation protein YlmC with PRC-barrel domain
MDYQHGSTLSASTMIGDDVRNLEGEHLGELKELMIDVRTGRVAYAVLSFGGILGIGDKLFAIPWEALSLDNEDHAFVLDANKEMLEDAPGFDKDDWPDTLDDDDTWLVEVYDYYGYEPYWRRPL